MGDLNELEKRIQRIEEHLGIQNKRRYKFEDLIEGLDRRTLEMIWTGVDTYNIAVSLIGLKVDQIRKVKGSFSKTRWAEITNEYQNPFMREITKSSVQVNREVILEKIHRLESMGEMVVAQDYDGKGEYVSWEEFLKERKGPFIDVDGWVRSVFD